MGDFKNFSCQVTHEGKNLLFSSLSTFHAILLDGFYQHLGYWGLKNQAWFLSMLHFTKKTVFLQTTHAALWIAKTKEFLAMTQQILSKNWEWKAWPEQWRLTNSFDLSAFSPVEKWIWNPKISPIRFLSFFAEKPQEAKLLQEFSASLHIKKLVCAWARFFH